jgi:hypothetical protein
MAEPKQPSRKHYAAHYPVVMRCAGLTKGGRFEREFDIAIFTISNSYWDARHQVTIARFQEVLAQYAKSQVMVLEALRSLDPIYSEINFAARLQDLPEAERDDEIARYLSIRGRVDRRKWDGGASNRDLDFMMAQRDRGIHFLKDHPDLLARLLRRQPGDYRKDPETALVIEPALDLLETIGFKPSRNLTRKAFFDALFDLIGIDQKRRPNSRSIDVIASMRRART